MAVAAKKAGEVISLDDRRKRRLIWVQVDADAWARLQESVRVLAEFDRRPL